MNTRRRLLGIVGDAGAHPDGANYGLARDLGRLAIDATFRIVCGGLGGVMEAACRGAHDSARYTDGSTIGLLPGFDPAVANQWIDIAIPTGLGHLRNGLVSNCDAVVAVGGGAGTLSEIAFAWMYMRPVIALSVDGWSGHLAGRPLDSRRTDKHAVGDVILAAGTADEAIKLAVRYCKTASRSEIAVGRPRIR